ncbi:MAG: hypothetical protein NW217_04360 [Hyphomicrobiaceae bacterium]|nr:hypothetical protein [Hyphomicrobiaceae bacterium]
MRIQLSWALRALLSGIVVVLAALLLSGCATSVAQVDAGKMVAENQAILVAHVQGTNRRVALLTGVVVENKSNAITLMWDAIDGSGGFALKAQWNNPVTMRVVKPGRYELKLIRAAENHVTYEISMSQSLVLDGIKAGDVVYIGSFNVDYTNKPPTVAISQDLESARAALQTVNPALAAKLKAAPMGKN